MNKYPFKIIAFEQKYYFKILEKLKILYFLIKHPVEKIQAFKISLGVPLSSIEPFFILKIKSHFFKVLIL